MTSLFAGSWFCQLCGFEACPDCHSTFQSDPEFCRSHPCYDASHAFRPLTRIPRPQLMAEVEKMDVWLRSHADSAAAVAEPYALPSRPAPDAAPCRLMGWIDRSALSNDTFGSIWKESAPFLVSNVQRREDYWTPDYFTSSQFADVPCELEDCQTGDVIASTVHAFFRLFRYRSHKLKATASWKLKVCC